MVLANLNDNIDCFEVRHMLKWLKNFSGQGRFDIVVDTYWKLLCLRITSPVMQVFSVTVLRGPVPDSIRNLFDTRNRT